MKTNITTSKFSSTAIFHIVIFVCVDRAASLVKVCSIHIHFKGLYLFSINDGREVLYSLVSWLLFHLMIYTFSIQCPQLIIFRRVALHKESSAKREYPFLSTWCILLTEKVLTFPTYSQIIKSTMIFELLSFLFKKIIWNKYFIYLIDWKISCINLLELRN